MRASERKTGVVVIECGSGPRNRAVALFTGLREARFRVIGIRRLLKILQMAAHARRVRDVVVVINVTLRALQLHVRAGQRKSRDRVVEGRVLP